MGEKRLAQLGAATAALFAVFNPAHFASRGSKVKGEKTPG
jgi:hypothetical protein